MKQLVRSRRAIYLLLGVLPAVAFLPLLLVLTRVPATAFDAIIWLSLCGIVGLCLATLVAPTEAHSGLSIFIALLLVCGVVVTSLLLFGFTVAALRDPLAMATQVLMLLLLALPTLIALHYILSVVRAHMAHRVA